MHEMHGQSPLSLIDLVDPHPSLQALLYVLEKKVPLLNKKFTYWNEYGHEITSLSDTFPLYEQHKLIGALQIARDITSLEKLIYQPLRRYGQPLTFDIITAVSQKMKDVISLAKKAAYTETPVLLIGESGTGKDMIAEGIHHFIEQRKTEFVTIFSRRENGFILTKLSEALHKQTPTTFFFERIEFLNIEQQQQLLELIKQTPTNHHMLIASTGRDPIELIANQLLLKELYYYFAAFSITVPPLRERTEDIKPFVEDYLARHRQRFQSQLHYVDCEVYDLFMSYDWPGNLKELELLLDEITSTITNEQTIQVEMLPLHFLFKTKKASSNDSPLFVPSTKKELVPLDQYLKDAEQFYLDNVLQLYNGNITKAAEAIGISRQNLQYRLKKYK